MQRDNRPSPAAESRTSVLSVKQSLRGSSFSTLALFPVLVLTGLPMVSVVVIIALLVFGTLLRPRLAVNGHQLWESDLELWAVFISIISMSIAVSGSLLPWLGAVVIIALVMALPRLRSDLVVGYSQQLSTGGLSVTNFALLYTGTLTLLGWSSLRYYALALLAYVIVRKQWSFARFSFIALPAVAAGFTLSLLELKRSEGQFWLSFDQLFRSSLAAGLANWGIDEQIGAVGTTVRYHWLGEGVSGVLANISYTTAINGVTRIVPALGIMISLTSLLAIGGRFQFSKFSSALAACLTILLGQVFEVFSVGSLWGITLFLIGLNSLIRLRASIQDDSKSYTSICVSIVTITPLLTLAQSTLGVHFLLLTGIIYASAGRGMFSRAGSAAVVLVTQLLVILALRRTLLASDNQHFYQPSLSLRNIMQFRGVDVYVGSQFLYVFGASLLFLLVMSQLFSGMSLASRNNKLDREAIRLFLAVSGASLILANVFSLGGEWAQQARFFVPMITLGTYLSLAMILRSFSSALKTRQYGSRVWVIAFLAGFATFLSILYLKYSVFGLPWSRTRTASVAGAILAVEIALILIIIVSRFRRTPGAASPILLSLIFSIAVTADGQQIRDQIGIHRSSLESRAESILGNADTQACLKYVRSRTTEKSIIASNWYRIPTSVRSAKYALIGASLERRTYLDGPNYLDLPQIDTPRPTPLEQRAIVVDGFAERASPESYEVLRSYGVEYFLVDRLEVVPDTWQPYADVVLENDRCFVLKLAT